MGINAVIIGLVICLVSCNDSSTNNTSAPAINEPTVTVDTPVVIDDITCDSDYSLAISSIYIEGTNTNISPLHDNEKLNSSMWKSDSIDSHLIVELTEPALLQQLLITWQHTEYVHLFNVYISKDNENWVLVDTNGQNSPNALIPDLITIATDSIGNTTAKYIKIELSGNELSQPSSLLEIEVFGCRTTVAHNIELSDWYLSVPTDTDGNGRSDSIKENELADGYFDPRFFRLSQDGGLTFTTSVSGYKTSNNTKYVRSELREMLRRGNESISTQGVNKNNWVFSSAPANDINNAGGVDGKLDASLSVNHVTSSGENYQIGRIVIGQIHANDDEPARLYYRKLPQNTNGSIYVAHEIAGGDDSYFDIIGSRSNDASDPENGIPLNERFDYSIEVNGNLLEVTITKLDGSTFSQIIDMKDSFYDVGGQYMYFKAGVYHLNNSSDQHDYAQATFYQITNSHTGY